jgi:hypothetical protein
MRDGILIPRVLKMFDKHKILKKNAYFNHFFLYKTLNKFIIRINYFLKLSI